MTEKSKEMIEKEEYLAILNRKSEREITCWADVYRNLRLTAMRYIENPDKENADFAILTLLSFVLAMEMLPEEGDILVIVKKMNEIMIMREDLTHTHVWVGDSALNQRAKIATQTMVALASMLGAIRPTDDNDDEDEPKIIH